MRKVTCRVKLLYILNFYPQVPESGKAKEFDDPWSLLQNDSTVFSQMVQETGPKQVGYLSIPFVTAKVIEIFFPILQVILTIDMLGFRQ